MTTHPDPDSAPDTGHDHARTARTPHHQPSSSPEGIADTGAFMCHQQTDPPVERSDVPSGRDLKQEAVLALLEMQAERGGEICTECERLVNRDAGLAWTAYAQARVDFYRSRRGRRGAAARVELSEVAAEEIAEMSEEPPDEQVQSRRVVRRIVRERLPGISERRLQRVMVVMSEAQDIKRSHRAEMPDRLRAALTRLRKATGLPLDTSLL